MFKKLIDNLIPVNTRRRQYYELGQTGLKTLKNEGIISFYHKFKNYTTDRFRLTHNSIIKEKLKPVQLPDKVLNVAVSVIIPTKNAGPDFIHVLDQLKSQSGIKQIELIVVDSGSTDGTAETAGKYGAKVHGIKPEEFHHGKTRNLGALKAQGKYLVFMTQDAVPADDHLIFDIVAALQTDPEIAAVCPRQIASRNADFYARFNTWHFTNVHLELAYDTVVSGFNTRLSPLQKRKLASITDICCCVPRKLFLKYMFTMGYAEDLELGVRLLRDGFKICYLYNTCVIHSHNRPADYTFKANYVTATTLPQIVGSEPSSAGTASIVDLYAAIVKLYCRLKYAVAQIRSSSAEEFMNVQGILKKATALPAEGISHGDPSLDSLFNYISAILDPSATDQKAIDSAFNYLHDGYVNVLPLFHQFAMIDEDRQLKKEELAETLYKIFASAAGSEMGNVMWKRLRGNAPDSYIARLNALLSAGI